MNTNTTATTTDLPCLADLVAKMREYQSQNELRKTAAQLAISSMAACPKCGCGAKYHGQPERIEMCRCMYNRLRQQVPLAEGAMDTLSAIRIDVVDWITDTLSVGETQ